MVVRGELVDRVRAALAAHSPVREVTMFGGLSFMVDGRIVVCARGDGDLLVRADPGRADELLAREGARPAEMGVGRSMGRGWIAVGPEALATEQAPASGWGWRSSAPPASRVCRSRGQVSRDGRSGQRGGSGAG